MKRQERNEMFKTLVNVKGLEHIEFKMQYRFSEFNVTQGKKIKQGYHLRIFPVELTEISRVIDSKSGLNICLVETKYRSVELYRKAMKHAKKSLPDYIKYIFERKEYPEDERQRVIKHIRDELISEIEYFTKDKR